MSKKVIIYFSFSQGNEDAKLKSLSERIEEITGVPNPFSDKIGESLTLFGGDKLLLVSIDALELREIHNMLDKDIIDKINREIFEGFRGKRIPAVANMEEGKLSDVWKLIDGEV